MLFNSLSFPIFLLIVLSGYYAVPPKWRRSVLLIASYTFYSLWNWKFSFLLATSTLVDYYCAHQMAAHTQPKHKKRYLLLSLATNLGILGFFKYFNFCIDSTAQLLSVLGFSPNLPVLQIILPVGISFYTFQTLSYSIDVYRGHIQPIRSLSLFALYVSFFPQLVAGPIERAKNLLPQLAHPKALDRSRVWQGLCLVLMGYLKKVALSDQIAPIADHAFAHWSQLSWWGLWEGVAVFGLQIYFDFSGYTDIARGVAKWFGIDLQINFKQPYFAASITDFWRRWHISLSSWLKEYLYIPLGGNRRGALRTYTNLFVTMLLGGLWHGANLTFVIWGGLHGAALALHKLGHRLVGNHRTHLLENSWAAKTLGILCTHLFVLFAWVFFRAPTVETAFQMVQKLFTVTGPFEPTTVAFIGLLYGLLLFMDLPIVKTQDEFYLTRFPKAVQVSYVTLSIAAIVLLGLQQPDARPFIYFQF